MVRTTSLFYAVPVLFQLVSATPSEHSLNRLVARQTVDPNSLPPSCQSPCQVINTMSGCAGNISCICTSTVGSQLQQCMSCLVNEDPNTQGQAQSALNTWNTACSGNLSLSGGSSSGGSTGTTGGSTSGTTGGTTSGSKSGTATATATGTSSSGGSSSNPSTSNGAVSFKTGGTTAMCAVAALAGAFMSF